MRVAVIGGGPAGLRAAEIAAQEGATLFLYEGKPSVGRKFLVAGRGGLNLTKAEPRERFVPRYLGAHPEPSGAWESLIGDFDNDALRAWAAGLGIETFAASTGRVYPKELKAAPLLRRWVERLRNLGVTLAMNHRWTGLTPLADGIELQFQHTGKEGTEQVTAQFDAVILALGGGSWPQTGSDGHWTEALCPHSIQISPLQPANSGWELVWPPALLEQIEGKPLKNIVASAGESTAAGELLITRYGLEGGALYQLGPALRQQLADQASTGVAPELVIDLKPSHSVSQLTARMQALPRDADLFAMARERWKLSDTAFALLSRCRESLDPDVGTLAAAVKAIRLPLLHPRPIAEAISSAGGVAWSELTPSLMIKRLPGVFVAGEMIDWEAPTGGYLIQGCFATGTRAGRAAAAWRRS